METRPEAPLNRLLRSQGIVLAGGCALAFGAAFANTGVFLHTGTSVSHLTGDISRLAIDLVRVTPEVISDLTRVAAAVVSFFAGALLAGLLVHHPTLDFARPYGRIVTGIGATFLAAALLLPQHPRAAIALSAFGCGLQNALATRYRGIVLRTTHLTGLITDFGTMAGMRLRGFDLPRWKVAVPACLTAAFFAGGGCACLTLLVLHLDPVFLAALGYLSAGLGWTLFKHVLLPRMTANRPE